jgi:RHS repeat-associated protein
MRNSANRLKTVNNGSYNTHFAYDGDNNRISKSIGASVTRYLLDTQVGLAVVLRETSGTNITNYLHHSTGIYAVEQNNVWDNVLQDGLGSVRMQHGTEVEATISHSPYGVEFDKIGTFTGTFGYAGEQVDENQLSYNRARYYSPTNGTFTGLDPFEGYEDEPLSLNGYSYVHGNPINLTDESGENPLALLGIAGLVGAGVGAVYAARQWDLSNSGECGCDAQKWARSTDRSGWILERTFIAGVMALNGAMLAMSLPITVTASVGLLGGTLGLLEGLDEFQFNPNPCTQLKRDLGILNYITSIIAALLIAGSLGGGGTPAPQRQWRTCSKEANGANACTY